MDDIDYYREKFGKPVEDMRGSVRIVDETANAVWTTGFFWPFAFDYYILDLTDDYSAVRWAIRVATTPGWRETGNSMM